MVAEDAGLVGGGLLQGGTDVGDLDDGVLRGGPHVRIETELRLTLASSGGKGHLATSTLSPPRSTL